jgi:DnaK suppressor protein
VGDDTAEQVALARRLQEERAAAAEQVRLLARDFARIVDASRESNADDEHDPEGQTIAFERAQVVSTLDQARERLAGIDAAIERQRAGSYGRCVDCGAPIDPERLAARPATTACIACARRGGGSAQP